MTRNNFMMDEETLRAIDRCRAEAHARGGAELSRSQTVRAFVRGLDEALRGLRVSMPAVTDEHELRIAVAQWIARRVHSTHPNR